MSSLNFRWRTANGPYTEYSALYPPAFGETCAFAFKIHKKYWFVPPSDLWEYAGVEIKSFVDDLYVQIPSEEQVLATAKDRLKDNSCTNYWLQGLVVFRWEIMWGTNILFKRILMQPMVSNSAVEGLTIWTLGCLVWLVKHFKARYFDPIHSGLQSFYLGPFLHLSLDQDFLQKNKGKRIDHDPGWPGLEKDLAPKIPIKTIRAWQKSKREGTWENNDKAPELIENKCEEPEAPKALVVSPTKPVKKKPKLQGNSTSEKDNMVMTATSSIPRTTGSGLLPAMFEAQRILDYISIHRTDVVLFSCQYVA